MDDIAIRVEGLGKRYAQRASGGAGYRTLREDLLALPRRLLRGGGVEQAEDFWALRDVSFEVRRGEVLGVIGRNGAGKSTLLKILSRIVEPTAGEVELRGRLGSLLEVGTGFHPELTGRENIFLSGAILGMRREEVRECFDDIVAFAEIADALDRPVKHYSSGMHARLGFAVAAHLRTEILLLDEVLAVGDVEFQRRCLGKMGEVARDGRTVVFVSHNLAAIRQMCSCGLWLSGGKVHRFGDAGALVADYLRAKESEGTQRREGVAGVAAARMEEARLVDASGQPAGECCVGDDVGVEFQLAVGPALVGRPIKLAVMLASGEGLALANMVDVDSGFALTSASPSQRLRVTIRDQRFYPGVYPISLWAGSTDSRVTYDRWDDALRLVVVGGGGASARPLPRSDGLLFLTPEWSFKP